jgi:Mg-chelatase subunit ChlD
MSQRARFGQVSPRPGAIDDAAFAEAFRDDPDETLALLADMASATDAQLRELARRLAGRVVVDLARGDVSPRRGVHRLRSVRHAADRGDLDLEASLDVLLESRAGGWAPPVDELHHRSWQRSHHALCLLVDRSGSMGGDRLATAAVAAAAVAWRAPGDHSVVAFAGDAIVLKSQDRPRPAAAVVDDLLALRGYGTTDIGLALRVASEQLARSSAHRKVVLMLSDGRPTAGADPLPEARRFAELHVLAPAGDRADAEPLARAGGGRCVELARPTAVPEALAALLG